MNRNTELAIKDGWRLVGPQYETHGGIPRVVRESYWYHPATGRYCYVEGQLPSYDEGDGE